MDVALERRTMSEDVYRRLREAIVVGELRPGECIRDYELAEDLGTSKAPVRHALGRLAEEGLVEMQRTGSRASRLSIPIGSAMRLRSSATSGKGSVRHAMPALQDDDVTYLVDLTDDMSAAVRERDVAAFGGALRAIAVGFARIEGNSIRVSAIEILGPQIRRFAQQARTSFDWDGSEKSAVDIREAIVRRDAVQARAAIVALFDEVLPGIIDRAEARERGAEPSA